MNREKVIQALKERHTQGLPMNANAVRKSDKPLYQACRTYFGAYRDSVEAAGIDYATVRLRHKWTPENTVQALQARAAQGLPMNYGAVEKDNKMLCYACCRYYESYVDALAAAGLKTSIRRRWTHDKVIEALKERHTQGLPMNANAVRKSDKPLYTACRTYFGAYRIAVDVAGIG